MKTSFVCLLALGMLVALLAIQTPAQAQVITTSDQFNTTVTLTTTSGP